MQKMKQQIQKAKVTLPILKYGNPLLRKKVEDIVKFDKLLEIPSNNPKFKEIINFVDER